MQLTILTIDCKDNFSNLEKNDTVIIYLMAHTPFRGELALSFVALVTSAAMRIGRGMPTPRCECGDWSRPQHKAGCRRHATIPRDDQ